MISHQADKSAILIAETSDETTYNGKRDDISNLTAEIESFVKTAAIITEENETDERLESTEGVVPAIQEVTLLKQLEKMGQMRQSPESNDFYVGDESARNLQDKLTVDKIQNLGAACDYDGVNNNEGGKRSPVKILIREPTEEDNKVEVATNIQLTDAASENKANDLTDTVLSDALANKIEKERTKEDKPRADCFAIDECNTPTSLEVENILENQNRYSIDSLRITESCDDLLNQLNEESTSNFEISNIPLQTMLVELPENDNLFEMKDETSTLSRFEVRTVPLKNCSPGPIRKNSCNETVKNVTTTDEAPPTPPRRLRTVKEIIESINKSQSLLKINQDNKKTEGQTTTANMNSQTSFATQEDGNSLDRNLNNSTDKNYNQQKKLFSDATDENGNHRTFKSTGDDIPLCVARYDEVSKNNSILFEKCLVGRSRNVHSAKESDKKTTNVEWNPLPKPRRHKHSP